MKLWLDDTRPAPKGWVWAKSAEEAKAYLILGIGERLSLDHDLGGDPVNGKYQDGGDLAKWMARTNFWPRRKPRVHSAHPVGAGKIRSIIERKWPKRQRLFPRRKPLFIQNE